MREDMGFIVKPVVQVGRVSPPPVVGCRRPERLTDTDYDALSNAAPFRPAEIAAILCGFKPFEMEPGDDPADVEGIERVRLRLEDAVRHGQIPAYPTLRDAVLWANQFGCAMVKADRLSVVAGAPVDKSIRGLDGQRKRRSDHDLVLQEHANRIAAQIRASGGSPHEKVVAEALKRELHLQIEVSTIIRRIRRS
jgi:hypothetical protein